MINIIKDAATQTSDRCVRQSKKCPNKKPYVVGWNKHVKHLHGQARLDYKMWVVQGKPNSGVFYKNMIESRKKFKCNLNGA